MARCSKKHVLTFLCGTSHVLHPLFFVDCYTWNFRYTLLNTDRENVGNAVFVLYALLFHGKFFSSLWYAVESLCAFVVPLLRGTLCNTNEISSYIVVRLGYFYCLGVTLQYQAVDASCVSCALDAGRFIEVLFCAVCLTKQRNMIRCSKPITNAAFCGKVVDISWKCLFGPLAHLVERFHGMEEARSSILLRSTGSFLWLCIRPYSSTDRTVPS